jgi:hypothetical protein
MNTVNSSTGFSPFQLQMGHSPHVIPPISPTPVVDTAQESEEATCATELIESLTLDTAEAKDNLFAAKVAQSEFANWHCTPEIPFCVGDKVLLSTTHRQREYVQAKSGHVAKTLLIMYLSIFDLTQSAAVVGSIANILGNNTELISL